MTRETKIGLLIGLAIIVLVAVIVSDYVAVQHRPEHADPLDDPTVTQVAQTPQPAVRPSPTIAQRPEPAPAPRHDPIPTPEEIDRALAEARDAHRAAREREAERFEPEQREPASLASAAAERLTERIMPPTLFAAETRTILTPDEIDETAPTRDFAPVPPAKPAPRPTPTRVATTTDAPTPAHPTLVHRVEAGETLYAIAERYLGDGDAWPRIARHNPETVPAHGRVVEGARLLIPHRNAPDQPALIDLGRVDRPRTITVETGDTLAALAARHLGSADRWPDLLEANRGTIDSADTIRVGQRLVLPSDEPAASPTPAAPTRSADTARRANPTEPFGGTRTYTVEDGDTLFAIARDTLGDGDRWQELYDANRHKLDSPDAVRPGQTLTLPQ